MSDSAWRAAMRRTRATRATTRTVLGALAAHMSDDGLSWPGFGLLVKETGLSRRAVITAIAELEQLGEIVRYVRAHALDAVQRSVKKRPPGGWQATNYYHLKLLRPATPKVVQLVHHLERKAGSAPGARKVVHHVHGGGSGSLFSEVPLEEEPPRPEAHKWFRHIRDLVHAHLREHPMGGGIELVETITRRCEAYHLDVSADVIGRAIETALEQRRRSADAGRPWQRKRRGA